MLVPVSVDSSVTRANLSVTATSAADLRAAGTGPASAASAGHYALQRHAVVGIRHDRLFTFIETDKPLYKPSDTGLCMPCYTTVDFVIEIF